MEAKLFIFAAVAISEVFSACKPSNTKFDNFQKAPKRSVRYVIGVNSKKCPGLDEFYYQWKVEELPGFREVQSSKTPTFSLDGYTYDSKVCFIKDYLLTVKVSHYPDMTLPDSAGEVFHFSPDNLFIEIAGGSDVAHLFGQDLVLDAKSLSKDLSYPPNEDAFAGNIITWQVTPPIPGFTPGKSLVLQVPAQYLELYKSYSFVVNVLRVKIPRNEMTQMASQTVRIVNGSVANLNLKCLRNCVFPHNMEPIALAVECSANCEDLKYSWQIVPKPAQEKLDFGGDSDKLIILEDSFKPGSLVTVVVAGGGSRSEYEIQFIKGIRKGKCAITPQRGISAVTKFFITCTGFQSPFGVVFYLVYQVIGNRKILINEDSYSSVSEVFLADGNPAVLNILVQDNSFLQVETILNVVVEKFTPPDKNSIVPAIKGMVLSDSDSVMAYSVEGFNNKVIQMVNALLDTIDDTKLEDSIVRDLHKHMVESIIRLEPIRFSSTVQRLSLLLEIWNRKLKDDTYTGMLIGKAAMRNVINAHMMHTHHEDAHIPQYYIDEFFQSNLQLITNLLNANVELKTILNMDTPEHEYDSYDDFVSKKLQIREDFKKLINSIIITLQTNCITILSKAIPGQKARYFETDMLIIKTRRELMSSFKLTPIIAQTNISKSKIFFPKKMVDELGTYGNYTDFQFAIFKKNPFWWHKDASTFNTDFILFDLFLHCDRIKQTESSFFVHLDTKLLPTKTLQGTLTDKAVAAYRIEIQPNSMFLARFVNVPEDFIQYKATWSDCFCNDEDFTSSRSRLINSATYNFERLMQIQTDNDGKVIYICVQKVTPTVTYEITISMFSCLYWDLKSQVWQKEGCKVRRANLENNSRIICECTHLSLYTGQIFVPPNDLTLDFEVDFKIFFKTNFVMICVVGGLLLLWLFFLLIAHLRDKEMKKRNVIYKLDDNVPGDRFPYLVVVFTGVFFDAATTADVAFQLIGTKAKSRVHLIKCRGATFLRRSAQDWFTIYTPYYLGNLKRIRLFHNSKGKSPHWYCERVIAQDLTNGEQYCFTVKKWFSVIWGSGKYYRKIRVRAHSGKIRKLLFLTQLEKDMKDNHLWMSILARDFQSNFSSKERVSVGFCFLFLSMLANAMFFGIPRGIPADSIDKQNNFHVAVRNVVIFLESWLVVTPMGLLIVFLFRNSAPL